MRYVWDRAQQAFVDRDGRQMEAPDRVCRPMIASDLPAYASPLGTGMIEGRAARREDLKRSGCREVEPDEFKPKFVNKGWAKRRGYKVEE